MTDRSIAVVGDGPLLTQVARVAHGELPRPHVERVADLDALPAALAGGGAQVVVVGPEFVVRNRLADLALLQDRFPAAAFLLVHDAEVRASARALVRTGAVDLLRNPDDEDLALSLERALEIAGGRIPEASAPGAPAATRRRVVTVASATGGCGKTFYAVNLAHFLTSQLGRQTCVVDLDLQFGEVSSALRLRPQATIFDLVRSELSDEELGEHLSDYVVTHESGIHVLAAPNDPSQADEVAPRDALRIIRALRLRFDDVIVDTPASLSELVLAAFDLSDELVVMVTPDVPSVRNLNLFLQTLAKLKVPAEHIAVVMNKAERNLGIDLDEVQRILGREFRMVLPYAREVSRSINIGMPVLGYSPDTELSRRLRSGIVESLPGDLRSSMGDDACGHPRRRRRLLRRPLAIRNANLGGAR